MNKPLSKLSILFSTALVFSTISTSVTTTASAAATSFESDTANALKIISASAPKKSVWVKDTPVTELNESLSGEIIPADLTIQNSNIDNDIAIPNALDDITDNSVTAFTTDTNGFDTYVVPVSSSSPTEFSSTTGDFVATAAIDASSTSGLNIMASNTLPVLDTNSSSDTTTTLKKNTAKYNYVFRGYSPTKYSNVDYFRLLGEATQANSTSSPVKLSYTQNQTKTVKWDVSGNISASASISSKFIGKIETKIGGSVTRSSTVGASSSISSSTTVPANTRVTIQAYQKGYRSSGSLVWDVYPRSSSAGTMGSPVGTYTESASGTVLKPSSFTFRTFSSKIKK